MLVEEGLDSLCNYTVRCFFFFIYSAVLQRCHNRGWTSPLPSLSVKRAADNGALCRRWPRPPNSAVAAVALTAGGQETAEYCMFARLLTPTTTTRLFQTTPLYISPMHCQHPIITPIHTDAIPATKNIFLHNNAINEIWILVLPYLTLKEHEPVLVINNLVLGFYLLILGLLLPLILILSYLE